MWIDSCLLTSLAGHLFRVRINQWVQVAKKSVLVFLKRFSTCVDISLGLFWQIQERHCMAWLKSNTIGNCAKCALLFSSSVVLFILEDRKRWNMRQHFNVFFFSDWLLDTFIFSYLGNKCICSLLWPSLIHFTQFLQKEKGGIYHFHCCSLLHCLLLEMERVMESKEASANLGKWS